MQSSPSTIYSQSIDKQRIVVVGKTNTRIIQMILHVLDCNNRKFDYSTRGNEKISDAPVVIIEPNGSNNPIAYKHHILIISTLFIEDKPLILNLANATPKSGVIIYDEADPLSKEIAETDRVDVTSSRYSVANHEMQNGKAVLISSTHERFPTQLSSSDDLKNISAAKDLLKKLGISSGQFYKTIGTFR
jgi:UDP-N-acetylmuramate: L-alanyl-gamma-D-glutamyl-meso-diaminopimelate ligase